VDASVIYAYLDPTDMSFARCTEALRTTPHQLVIPALVLGEVLHLVGQRLTPAIESQFLASLATKDIPVPSAVDWPRIAELVQAYRSLRLGGVDASIIALAERLNTDLIFTLDRRHFSVVRPRHMPAFRLPPE